MRETTTDATKHDSVRVYVEQQVPEVSVPVKFEVLLHQHIATKDDRFETDIFQGEVTEEIPDDGGSVYPYEEGESVVVTEHAIIDVAESSEYNTLDPLFLPKFDVGDADEYTPPKTERTK